MNDVKTTGEVKMTPHVLAQQWETSVRQSIQSFQLSTYTISLICIDQQYKVKIEFPKSEEHKLLPLKNGWVYDSHLLFAPF
jgi:hypothetical protein